MRWSLYRWIWRLESPLYVGMPPAGSVNRCRLYVPARAVWGAVTAEIARAKAISRFPEYDQVGGKIREHVRFTYLFPAEHVGEDWYAWLPRYVRAQGLVWQREGADDKGLPDRQFRMRLLSTRPSTAIEPTSDTAAEGSLRETECINTRWRDPDGQPGGPVALLGYVFLHGGLAADLRAKLEQLDAITVGGDTRYGLGRLRREGKMEEVNNNVFSCTVDLHKDGPTITTDRALAHAKVDRKASVTLWGNMELLRGWNHGKSDDSPNPLWVPGSVAEKQQEWRIEAEGYWALSDNRA